MALSKYTNKLHEDQTTLSIQSSSGAFDRSSRNALIAFIRFRKIHQRVAYASLVNF